MQHLWSGCFIEGREPALALNHHLLSSTVRSQLDDAEPVGGQIKKLFESRLVCHSITLPWESAWAGGGVTGLKWNLRAAITWLRPAPVFSRRLLDISLTSSRHPGKKKPPPPEKVSKAFWNAAPQRSRLQMILEIHSVLKKRGGIQSDGGNFSERRPDPERSAFCREPRFSVALLKLNSHFELLTFQTGRCILKPFPCSLKWARDREIYFTLPWALWETKVICRHISVKRSLRVRLSAEFIFSRQPQKKQTNILCFCCLPAVPFYPLLWTERVFAWQKRTQRQ